MLIYYFLQIEIIHNITRNTRTSRIKGQHDMVSDLERSKVFIYAFYQPATLHNELTTQIMKQPTKQPISQITNQQASQSTMQAPSQPVNQSTNQPASKPDIQISSQWERQPACLPASQPINYTAIQSTI